MYKFAYTRDFLLCCKIRQCSFLYLVIRSPGNKYLFQEGKIALCGPFQTNFILYSDLHFIYYKISSLSMYYGMGAQHLRIHSSDIPTCVFFDPTKTTFSDRNNYHAAICALQTDRRIKITEPGKSSSVLG
jgi:hypothetical protein